MSKKIILAIATISTITAMSSSPSIAGWGNPFKKIKETVEKTVEATTSVVTAPAQVVVDTVQGKNVADAVQDRTHEVLDAHKDATQSAADTTTAVNEQIENETRAALGDSAGDVVRIVNQPQNQAAQYGAAGVAAGVEIAKGNGLDSPVYALLAAAIRNAEASHFAESKPIPDHVKKELKGRIPDTVLDQARYISGRHLSIDVAELLNAGVKLQNGGDNAIAVNRVIVFAKDPGTDYDWWAHELAHVWQYQDWTVDGFAERYVKNCPSLEQDADTRAGLPKDQHTSCVG